MLREDDIRPTAIVSIAYDAEERRRDGGAIAKTPVDDLRSSLEALAPEDGALLRAIRRPLAIENVGPQRLGNLVIDAIAHGFGGYAQASTWLGERLGIAGAVLPATVGPVQRRIDTSQGMPSLARAGRLVFVGGSLRSPRAAVAAIEHAEWVLLAPGPLYRSVIATAAVPDLARALSTTPAAVLWIASPETRALRRGRIRSGSRVCSCCALTGSVSMPWSMTPRRPTDSIAANCCAAGLRRSRARFATPRTSRAAHPSRLLAGLIRLPGPSAAGGSL